MLPKSFIEGKLITFGAEAWHRSLRLVKGESILLL